MVIGNYLKKKNFVQKFPSYFLFLSKWTTDFIYEAKNNIIYMEEK